ncbi:MAG: hypothetical protein GYA34_15305, partial [Chloroflexi bacterium]|nr:hypothetical protein [Chloroflexota bacterium]
MGRTTISRRQFMKIGGVTALSLAFSPLDKALNFFSDENKPYHLGRTTISLRYYEKPTIASRELGYYLTDETVKIYETALG